MKKLLGSMLLASTLLFPAHASFAANAETATQSATQQVHQNIIKNLTELGVDKHTQKKLIAKYDRGQLWDSMDPEKVAAVEKEWQQNKKITSHRYVFPDGSVLVSEVSGGTVTSGTVTSGAEITPMLSGGTVSSGTGYQNVSGAKAYHSNGFTTMQYFVNYTLVQQGPDQITAAYSPSATTSGGTYTDITPCQVTIPQEYIGSSSYAAQADWIIRVNYTQGAGSKDFRLSVYAGSDQAWQDTVGTF